jgi:hypothetical protein
MKLSASEQRLLDFAHEQFGEPLTQFLLAGLGETLTAQSWLFTVEFIDDGATLKRELQVSASEQPDGPTRLPQRREPLVILALLRLFILRDQRPSTSLSYSIEEVLEVLGWKDTARTRRIVDEAVECYSSLMYRWAMGDNELALRRLAFYNSTECFVSGFSRLDEEGKDARHLTRVLNRIDFNKEFVEGLRQRSLFEIAWDQAQSTRRI